MASTINPLFNAQQLSAAAATYFTAQVSTQILKLTIANTEPATAYTVSIHLVPAGDVAGPANLIVNERSLQGGESWDVWPAIGAVLGVGDMIAAVASVADKVNIFGSGLMVSG